MIALSFPNPNKTVYVPSTNSNAPWSGEFDKARKLGLQVYEYNKRCGIVETALKTLDYGKGDVVFPYSAGLFYKHGKAIVVAVCHKYDDYGDAKWEDKCPLLISAHWEDKPNEIFNCTIGYLQKAAPEGVKEL